MTVAQNLAYPLRMRKMSKPEIQIKVDKAIEMVRPEGMQNRRPSELSGGQQQRVALARALVFEPSLILMDEPLGALDKTLREHMQYEIKQIHRDLGVTMVYVTHDQSEALAMSDRIAIFERGSVVQIASPQELYEQPANVFVAGFIGENNIISGQSEGMDERGCGTIRLDCGQTVSAHLSSEVCQYRHPCEDSRSTRASCDRHSGAKPDQSVQGNGHRHYLPWRSFACTGGYGAWANDGGTQATSGFHHETGGGRSNSNRLERE